MYNMNNKSIFRGGGIDYLLTIPPLRIANIIHIIHIVHMRGGFYHET